MIVGNDIILCPVCEGRRGNASCPYCNGEGQTTTFTVEFIDNQYKQYRKTQER